MFVLQHTGKKYELEHKIRPCDWIDLFKHNNAVVVVLKWKEEIKNMHDRLGSDTLYDDHFVVIERSTKIKEKRRPLERREYIDILLAAEKEVQGETLDPDLFCKLKDRKKQKRGRPTGLKYPNGYKKAKTSNPDWF